MRTALAPEQEILDAIDRHYGESERATIEGFDEDAQADLEHLRDMASEAPVIRLVNAIITDAVEKRAAYPIPQQQMIDTIGAFEAITRSLETGAPVRVADL